MTAPPRRLRFDLVETLALVGLAVIVTWVASAGGRGIPPEARAFRDTYGRAEYSFEDEELFIKDFFKGRKGGVFLDVGAGDYQQYSNTYWLEREMGWSGIAVDAAAEHGEGYRQHRPRTRFFSFFVSDVSNARETLWVPRDNPLMSSSDRAYAEGAAQSRQVATITLDELLDHERVSKIDFLSMDIELAEPRALRGFDVERYRPDLVCIESHIPVRQQILDYFARHKYVVLGRYLRADEHNLYFAPLPAE
jgi:FkbM family methyltransferase